MSSLTTLSDELVARVCNRLQPTQSVRLGQTCQRLYRVLIPAVWAHIGFSTRDYYVRGKHLLCHKGHNLHSSPGIERNVFSTDPIRMDNLTFLLLNDIIRPKTLSYIKTVTICSGYEIGNLMTRWTIRPAPSLNELSIGITNKRAAYDTAIMDIFQDYPIMSAEKLDKYTKLFSDPEYFDWKFLFSYTKRLLKESNGQFRSFFFLNGQKLKVGKGIGRCEFDILSRCLSGDRTSTFEQVEKLAMHRFSFAKFITSKLCSFYNLKMLVIDINETFAKPCYSFINTNEEVEFCSRAFHLLHHVNKLLERLPKLQLGLNIHLPMLLGKDKHIDPYLKSRITVLRLGTYDTGLDYAYAARFLRSFRTSKMIKTVEFSTSQEFVEPGPISLAHEFRAIAEFLIREIGDLSVGPSLNQLSIFSPFLTAHFRTIPYLGARMGSIKLELTVNLSDLREITYLGELLSSKNPGLKHLRVISTTEMIPVPSYDEITFGCNDLEKLELYNFYSPSCGDVEDIFEKKRKDQLMCTVVTPSYLYRY